MIFIILVFIFTLSEISHIVQLSVDPKRGFEYLNNFINLFHVTGLFIPPENIRKPIMVFPMFLGGIDETSAMKRVTVFYCLSILFYCLCILLSTVFYCLGSTRMSPPDLFFRMPMNLIKPMTMTFKHSHVETMRQIYL